MSHAITMTNRPSSKLKDDYLIYRDEDGTLYFRADADDNECFCLYADGSFGHHSLCLAAVPVKITEIITEDL